MSGSRIDKTAQVTMIATRSFSGKEGLKRTGQRFSTTEARAQELVKRSLALRERNQNPSETKVITPSESKITKPLEEKQTTMPKRSRRRGR